MDREQFLENMRASKVPLVPFQIDGWDGVVYMRQQTIGEVRDIIMRDGAKKDDGKPDSLMLARAIARVVRDEKGALLFNEDDEMEMQELMDVMSEAAPAISRQIHEAYRALNEPSAAEVDPKGN